MKRFEVKSHLDRASGMFKKDIFIDDELFEYEVDANSLKRASELGSSHAKQITIELQKHFLNCLSEFVGRELSSQDVIDANKTGWI